MILVTGPTGSGKTTTLYASLEAINSAEKKIITIEDPVEYRLSGVTQIQVKPGIGLTFARGMRHIVRQDPDVVLVGEIRDRETAAPVGPAQKSGPVSGAFSANDGHRGRDRAPTSGMVRKMRSSRQVLYPKIA